MASEHRLGKNRQDQVCLDRDRSKQFGHPKVFVYYDLLDARNVPLARNVANQFIEPHQTVNIASDSYIMTTDLPMVKSSRATVKVGFP